MALRLVAGLAYLLSAMPCPEVDAALPGLQLVEAGASTAETGMPCLHMSAASL
jgi:hypothetical protein